MPGGGSKKGQRRGGRTKGTPNKVSASVKAALTEAFEELGGVKSLVAWGRDNPGAFYPLWSRMLPTEIKNADGESFRFTLGDDVRKRLEDVDRDGPGQPGEARGARPAGLEDAPAPAGD